MSGAGATEQGVSSVQFSAIQFNSNSSWAPMECSQHMYGFKKSQSLCGTLGMALQAEGRVCAEEEWPNIVSLGDVCRWRVVGATELG